jgi:hypothetical protein
MKCSHVQDIIPMLAALRASLHQHEHPRGEGTTKNRHWPFITISRQAGAGGRSFAERLARRLNDINPADMPWTVWDNELVERVAAEHHLPAASVAAIEDERPNWLEHALGGLTVGSTANYPDELKVYHGVATTIRALAEIGRVVIVGRGAGLVTRGMPGGVHLRLVAPLDHRIAMTALRMGVTTAAASEWVGDKDRNREAFYHRHWPKHPPIPENFTATFNTAVLGIDQLVESVLPLIGIKRGCGCTSTNAGSPAIRRCGHAEKHSIS